MDIRQRAARRDSASGRRSFIHRLDAGPRVLVRRPFWRCQKHQSVTRCVTQRGDAVPVAEGRPIATLAAQEPRSIEHRWRARRSHANANSASSSQAKPGCGRYRFGAIALASFTPVLAANAESSARRCSGSSTLQADVLVMHLAVPLPPFEPMPCEIQAQSLL
jgi:hypothetical protein